MRALITLVACALFAESSAQSIISGTVYDQDGNPVSGSNIYFDGSYDGTTSNEEGEYRLSTDLNGTQRLTASSIGYEKFTKNILIHKKDTCIHIVLHESRSQLDEVVITAGIFNASDKKKSATLSSVDIATTASAMGDIYGAYATMPGSQKVGEDGMLFVRGGDSYEVKTFMDGMLVRSPFYSKIPDIPTRGRYSPLLFSETLFSTGGYSAEYGQALSSIVDLSTTGLETENKTSIAIMTVGANASASRRWENSSLALTGTYANNALHHKIFRQTIDWIENPVLGDGTVMYRQKVNDSGMLKVFCGVNYNAMHLNNENFEQGTVDEIELTNKTFYLNASYVDQPKEKWLLRTGLSYGRDKDNMTYNTLPVSTINQAVHAKLVFTNLTSDRVKIRIGGELQTEKYSQQIDMNPVLSWGFTDFQPGLFTETELKIGPTIALRAGGRAEYSSLLEEAGFSPRISAAYKTGEYSQVSLAYGIFHQKPGNDYLKFAPGLSSERSEHYILNFQYKKNLRLFRVEAYVKQYHDLVKYTEAYSSDPSAYSNSGFGIAKGFDLFWRDRKTIKGSDYWISYSYLDTRRDYRDFPEAAAPGYASKHNLSIVYKHFINPLKTFVGCTYSFASGRPYDDKNSLQFMAARTKTYNDISLGLTHLAQVFGKQAIIHLNITNIIGFKNIYGYRFSDTPGEDGLYASRAVVPTVGRQAVLMLLLSL